MALFSRAKESTLLELLNQGAQFHGLAGQIGHGLGRLVHMTSLVSVEIRLMFSAPRVISSLVADCCSTAVRLLW